MFKKILIVLCLGFVLVGQSVLARQGCCSKHGGTCGCECCDGKPLSAVCRPYYPECESVANEADRPHLQRNENDKNNSGLPNGLPNGWQLVVAYALGVSFVFFFVKIRYKR